MPLSSASLDSGPTDSRFWTWDQQRVLGAVVAVAVAWCGLLCWLPRLEISRAAPLITRFWLDVDQAGWPELTLLPGVGKVTAQRIVANREQHGPFGPDLPLERVPGIGPKTFQRIAPWIRPADPLSAEVLPSAGPDNQRH